MSRKFIFTLIMLLVSTVCIAKGNGQMPLSYSIVDGADDVPLLVAEGGNPEGPTILFIHGMSQSHLSWRPQFESDLAKTHRLVAFDMRGHGGSGKPWNVKDYSTKNKVWARDVASVIEAKNLHNVTIVAWSFGGHVAVSYVREFGTKKLNAINLSGTLAGLVEIERVPSAKHAKIMEGSRQRGSLNLADNILGYKAMPESFTLAPMSDKDTEIAIVTGFMNPSYVRRAMTELPIYNTDVAALIDIPVLLTVGSHDEEWPVESARSLAETLPQGQLSVFAKTGHFPSMESVTRFNEELRKLSTGVPIDAKSAFSSPPSKQQMREKYASDTSSFLDVDGVDLHYRDEGHGPTLVLLPGHMGSLHMYEAWMPFLTPHFRVIRIDWPPYGLSLPDPTGVYSSTRAAQLVIDFLETKQLSKVHLSGTSNGATVAAHIAAMRPELVERLALSTFPIGVPPKRVISEELLKQANAHFSNKEFRPVSLYKAILEDIFADANNVTPELVAQYTDINNYPGGYKAQDEYIKNNRAMYDSGSLTALYAKIQAPTLVQWGDGGVVMPPETAQPSVDILVNAPVLLKRYPQAGHMPMLELPEQTATDLVRFLNGSDDKDLNRVGG